MFGARRPRPTKSRAARPKAAAGPSIWDTFSHTPGKTARGETGDVACDSYHRWREDVQLLADMHLGAYRFSIAWPRIAPTGGTDWNAGGLAYYDKLVDALLEKGIEPYVTLYHWDLPQALEDKGGWQNIDTAKAFAQYAAKLGEHFKGRVRHWFTINEIACIVGMGYGNGLHAPGLQLPLEGQFACWQHVVYAHCLAAQALRAADAANRVGFASTGRLCYPAGGSEADIAAARALTFACPDDDWTFTHQMALDPLCLGRWPQENVGPRLAAAIARVPGEITAALRPGKPDMLGLNIYNAAPVRMGAAGPEYVERPTGYPRTAIGWPVEPDSLDWGPYFIAERYGLPLYISENGLSCNDWVSLDGQVHDPRPHRLHRPLPARAGKRHPARGGRARVLPLVADGQLRMAQRLQRAVRPGVHGLPHRPPPPQRQRPLVRAHRRNKRRRVGVRGKQQNSPRGTAKTACAPGAFFV